MELNHAVIPQGKWKKLTFRLVVCFCLMLMPFIDAPTLDPGAPLEFNSSVLLIDIVLHFLCLVFGYVNFFFFLPRFYFNKSRLVYLLLIIASFLVICSIPAFLSILPFVPYFPNQEELQIHTIVQVRHIFLLYVVTVLFGILTQAEIRRRQAEREKMIAEMQYMRSRINPHFLFNTLNSIYGLIQVDPEKAGESLLKMSNIMRYILTASEDMYMPLTLSVQYIEEYISLQKERFQSTIEVDFQNNIDRQDLKITPLLLIPFIENAFKYGVSPGNCSPIIIRLSNKGSELHMYVSNVDYSHKKDPKNSTGIGIPNTASRLELLYKNKHQLSLRREAGNFIVDLYITLNKL